MHISFSHRYSKLHRQESARLLSIELRGRCELSDVFVEYDTVFDGGHYPLPAGRYMVMVFLGNELIPFTTVRRWTEKKFWYYKSGIGSIFNIRYADAENSGAPEFIAQQPQYAI